MQLYSKHLDRKLDLEDVSGKNMRALKVFSLSIEFLKNDVLTTLGVQGKSGKDSGETEEKEMKMELTEKDIQWVLTVPAIWDDAAKQFMREAAKEAGIPNENLHIGLEPEAASIYCRCLPSTEIKGSFSGLQEGTKYMILDAGGGTVDITVHEIGERGRLQERHRPSGGHWGGTRVDQEFHKFLEEVFGDGIIDEMRNKHMEEFLEICSEFEVKKRLTKPEMGEKVTVRIPTAFGEVVESLHGSTLRDAIKTSPYMDKISLASDKLRIEYDVFKGFFKFAVDETVKKVSEILRHDDVRGCKKILMVGGFSDSLILQEAMVSRFPEHEVVVPIETELCIIKGAVIFGHDPNFIAERKLKFTYGVSKVHPKTEECQHSPGETKELLGILHCLNIFDVHVHAGQIVKFGEELPERVYQPLHPLASEINVELYSSTELNPTFVTDKGCRRIGSMKIPLTSNFLTVLMGGNPFGVTFLFGGTEIKVEAVNKVTGSKTEVVLDYLDT